MHYLNVSFTHKNSTMEIREKLSYPDDENKHGCLKALTSCDEITGAILISTCNRMEVLCNCTDVDIATEHVFKMLHARSKISIDKLKERADIFDDSTAIHHLFSVAASLDSMVLGETQIVGQLKDAFRFAYDNGYCGKKLARAMKNAFKCAANVRNTTEISSKSVSIASVAVTKLKSLVNDLSNKKALIIGVGEMSEITAKHLITAGVDVYIMNRTIHKAGALAQECGCKVVEFEKLPNAVNEFDILFTATSAPQPIITADMAKNADFERYWFDLALPRDIAQNENEKIHLFEIDDLKTIVDENIEFREEASRQAHGIIGRAVVEFFEWLDHQEVEPIIKEIYIKAKEAAHDETQRVLKAGYLPKEYEYEAQKMCEQTLKRFLHEMVKNMRDDSDEAHAKIITTAMSTIMKEKGLK